MFSEWIRHVCTKNDPGHPAQLDTSYFSTPLPALQSSPDDHCSNTELTNDNFCKSGQIPNVVDSQNSQLWNLHRWQKYQRTKSGSATCHHVTSLEGQIFIQPGWHPIWEGRSGQTDSQFGCLSMILPSFRTAFVASHLHPISTITLKCSAVIE